MLVTGAGGFIGRAMPDVLQRAGLRVRGSVRSAGGGGARLYPEVAAAGAIGPDTDWRSALEGVDLVLHLAGRAHILRERCADPLAEFRRVNVLGTERLAEAAARAGVRRLVYASSIKVNGESTNGRPFRESDLPAPADAYGLSKLEAEERLRAVARRSGLEIVIVRPVLVYGPGVKANFLTLLRLVRRGVPLPLASIRTARSMTGLGNLADFFARCLTHPRAAGETFLVADPTPLSTAGWVRRIAIALHRPPRLLPFPSTLLRLGARVAGKTGLHQRLCESLVVETGKAADYLDWRPPFSTDEELDRTARWFLEGQSACRC